MEGSELDQMHEFFEDITWNCMQFGNIKQIHAHLEEESRPIMTIASIWKWKKSETFIKKRWNQSRKTLQNPFCCNCVEITNNTTSFFNEMTIRS